MQRSLQATGCGCNRAAQDIPAVYTPWRSRTYASLASTGVAHLLGRYVLLLLLLAVGDHAAHQAFFTSGAKAASSLTDKRIGFCQLIASSVMTRQSQNPSLCGNACSATACAASYYSASTHLPVAAFSLGTPKLYYRKSYVTVRRHTAYRYSLTTWSNFWPAFSYLFGPRRLLVTRVWYSIRGASPVPGSS